MLTAMACGAAVMAQFVSGKATRDALFLTSLDYRSLPAMLVATSVCSLVLVAVNTRVASRIAPSRLVPALFLASGLLFVVEWLLRSSAPQLAAVLVYLHVSGAGPLLASGFWLISSERFDPRTAKKHFGQIAGAGTLGGLLGALAAERVAALYGAPAMLLLLAIINVLSAWLIRRLALESPESSVVSPSPEPNIPARSGLRVVAEAPYLRHLAALVLFGTTSAALVDYLFKAQAVETFGRGDHLLRFFAIFYAATSLLTFVLQTSSSRAVLERFGLAATASTPSGALFVGSLVSLFSPGFGSLVVARGGESVFRSSLFRAGYELFYTPIPAAEKRAAKSLIDVGFDRLGDAFGGGLVRLAIIAVPAAQSPAILALALVFSAGAMFVASRLNRGYIGTLENSLINRAGEMDFPVDEERSTRALLQSLRTLAATKEPSAPIATRKVDALMKDPDMQDILSLRSRDRERVIEVLSRDEDLTPALVPHVIRLLAWEPVADHAMFALQKVAEERVGQLIDALIDPNQDFAVRRRLARVFSVCVSQRAADGLMLGLDDLRFDVRSQSARSLAAILDKNPKIDISTERVFAIVMREVTVGRPVWESRRLLETAGGESPLDAFVRTRAGASLAHVFTVLSLVLQKEPLQIALRSLQTDDEQLQGTALEYLESVLPAPIRLRLWPFLEYKPIIESTRPRNEIIAELLRSNLSILLNLDELRRSSKSHLSSAV
jgi:ATP:ADP antiporter, AAA family